MTRKIVRKFKSPAFRAIHASASALLKVGAISKETMRKNYDFSNARRGAVLSVPPGKTRITIRLDDDVITWFHKRVNDAGGGNYHTLINQALRQLVDAPAEPIEDTLRRVIREGLRRLAPMRRRT